MTVKKLYLRLENLMREYPECESFPVIYTESDESCIFHKVDKSPSLCQVEDLEQSNLKFIYPKDIENFDINDCNAVIIN